METIYDLIILGAGPAGLAAGLYGGRYRLNTLLVERGQDGGQIAITSDIENYPGQMVEAEESGATLIARMTKQVDKFGVHRVIHRRDQLRAAQSIQEKAFRNEKLHFMWDSVVDEVRGDGILDVMVVRNVKTGELTQVNADPDDGMFGLFGFIGYLPNTGLLEGTGLAMEDGYIRTDEDMRTNISGVYAAGDVRVKSLRQVVTAAADGAIAACQAEHYVADLQ